MFVVQRGTPVASSVTALGYPAQEVLRAVSIQSVFQIGSWGVLDCRIVPRTGFALHGWGRDLPMRLENPTSAVGWFDRTKPSRVKADIFRLVLVLDADSIRCYESYFDSRASRSRHRARTCSPRWASQRAAASPPGVFASAALGVRARGSTGCGTGGLAPSGILICGVTLPSGCPVVASIDRSASVGRVLLAGCRAGATSTVGGAEAAGSPGVF